LKYVKKFGAYENSCGYTPHQSYGPYRVRLFELWVNLKIVVIASKIFNRTKVTLKLSPLAT
jgi:hypothetical protein